MAAPSVTPIKKVTNRHKLFSLWWHVNLIHTDVTEVRGRHFHPDLSNIPPLEKSNREVLLPQLLAIIIMEGSLNRRYAWRRLVRNKKLKQHISITGLAALPNGLYQPGHSQRLK